MHLPASGVTAEDNWEYSRGVPALPVLWIRDSRGRWHTTLGGRLGTGEVMLQLAITPRWRPTGGRRNRWYRRSR
jgi:hypothetical protein